MRKPLAVGFLVVFGAVAGFVGHQLDQHPKIQSALTDTANDIEVTRYFRSLGFSCGVEAWSIKTMQDAAAGNVPLTPVRTNIPTLIGLPTVAGQRTSPATVYKLTGTRLIAYKLEADSDIHLVLRSTLGSQPTMIAEIPDPGCASGSVALAQITQARADFVAQVGPPQTYFVHVNDSVTLTGQGFGDFQHGQTGVAVNAVELHPVLSFKRNL